MLRNNFKKRILTLLIAIVLGIATYSQTVTAYSDLLKSKGYTYTEAPTATESALISPDGKYLVLVYSDENSGTISGFIVVVVLKSDKVRSSTNFNNVEPVALYHSKWSDIYVEDGIISTYEDGRVQITLICFR